MPLSVDGSSAGPPFSKDFPCVDLSYLIFGRGHIASSPDI